MNPGILPGRYRHFKGSDYEVLGLARHSESDQKMVVYRPLYACPELADEYGDDPWFVRPFAMFSEIVEHNGKQVPRFAYIGPMSRE